MPDIEKRPSRPLTDEDFKRLQFWSHSDGNSGAHNVGLTHDANGTYFPDATATAAFSSALSAAFKGLQNPSNG